MRLKLIPRKKDIYENLAKYKKIYEKLNDKISKNSFQNVLNFKLSGDNRYLCDDIVDKQYFEPFLNLAKNPIFVDGGGFVGDTSLNFIKNYPNFNKIYLFEPEFKHFEKAKANLKGFEVEFFQKGLGERDEILRFSSSGATSKLDENGALCVEITSIDEAVNGRVDFIKMDIEGAEISALKGAAKTIKAYTPTLAICAYHKSTDFWEIAEFILSLNADYKLYFRHYTTSAVESVLYFVAD